MKSQKSKQQPKKAEEKVYHLKASILQKAIDDLGEMVLTRANHAYIMRVMTKLIEE